MVVLSADHAARIFAAWDGDQARLHRVAGEGGRPSHPSRVREPRDQPHDVTMAARRVWGAEAVEYRHAKSEVALDARWMLAFRRHVRSLSDLVGRLEAVSDACQNPRDRRWR